MICSPCDERSTSVKPVSEMFQKTLVVNLDRHAGRWSAFQARLPADWPFPAPERFSAVDGKKCPVPPWWRQGGGAWGCFRSHQMIIEQCLNSGIDSVLFLEDDALFAENFTPDVTQFLQHLPSDWEMAY